MFQITVAESFKHSLNGACQWTSSEAASWLLHFTQPLNLLSSIQCDNYCLDLCWGYFTNIELEQLVSFVRISRWLPGQETDWQSGWGCGKAWYWWHRRLALLEVVCWAELAEAWLGLSWRAVLSIGRACSCWRGGGASLVAINSYQLMLSCIHQTKA